MSELKSFSFLEPVFDVVLEDAGLIPGDTVAVVCADGVVVVSREDSGDLNVSVLGTVIHLDHRLGVFTESSEDGD